MYILVQHFHSVTERIFTPVIRAECIIPIIDDDKIKINIAKTFLGKAKFIGEQVIKQS